MLLASPFGRSELELHTKVQFHFSGSWVKQWLILNDFFLYYKDEVSFRHHLTYKFKLTWRLCLFVATLLSSCEYIFLLSKQKFSCSLTGHIGHPQSYRLLNLKWLTYFQHAIQPLFNMYLCLYSFFKPHQTTYHSNKGVWLRHVTKLGIR